MDAPQENSQDIAHYPDITLDSEAFIPRMLKLYEDLRFLAAEIEPDDSVCLQIVQSPGRLNTYGGSSMPDVTPVLAAVLQAGLERRIAIAEQVRAALAPAWQVLSR